MSVSCVSTGTSGFEYVFFARHIDRSTLPPTSAHHRGHHNVVIIAMIMLMNDRHGVPVGGMCRKTLGLMMMPPGAAMKIVPS
jgi:hypothetical protein